MTIVINATCGNSERSLYFACEKAYFIRTPQVPCGLWSAWAPNAATAELAAFSHCTMPVPRQYAEFGPCLSLTASTHRPVGPRGRCQRARPLAFKT